MNVVTDTLVAPALAKELVVTDWREVPKESQSVVPLGIWHGRGVVRSVEYDLDGISEVEALNVWPVADVGFVNVLDNVIVEPEMLVIVVLSGMYAFPYTRPPIWRPAVLDSDEIWFV